MWRTEKREEFYALVGSQVIGDLSYEEICGHFSQIVWKSTTHAGFGMAQSPDGCKVIVVGIYFPPGNFKDEWCENVPTPISGECYIPSKEDICGLPSPSPTTEPTPKQTPSVEDSSTDKIIHITKRPSNHSVERYDAVTNCGVLTVKRDGEPKEQILSQSTEMVQLRPNTQSECKKAAHVKEVHTIRAISPNSVDDTFEVHMWYDPSSGNTIPIYRPAEPLCIEDIRIFYDALSSISVLLRER
ncbi:unnamed protein product [Echinostoma caproni]|uniref:SCP domain-containing protein n=1 Tax=Echinostoma caproni TaxID=27848 RepID=A0A183AAJ1_9TREM|nr:unnamed protein product [Echinostoma caproni]